MAIDPRLIRATRLQLEERDAALADGAERVGWKLGMGDSERIGSGPAVGHLTSATRLEPGASVCIAAYEAPHADVEIAVQFAADADPEVDVSRAIGGYACALELVDLGTSGDPPDAIVATNIFHRAFALGPRVDRLPDGVVGTLLVNGTVRAVCPADDLSKRLRRTAQLLAEVGEELRAGDWVITGSVVQEPVAEGDELCADLGPLGSVTLQLLR